MVRHSHTIHIDRPVGQVFAYLAEPAHLRDWQSSLIENRLLTEGPLRAGSRFREVRRTGPGKTELEAEVVVFDEPSGRLSTRTLTKPPVTVSYALDPDAGGTRLRYEFGMRTAGLMRLMEPLTAASIRKDTSADMQRLKSLLEAAGG